MNKKTKSNKSTKNTETKTEVISTTVKINPERYPLLTALHEQCPLAMAEVYRRLTNQYIKDHGLHDLHPYDILDSCASLVNRKTSSQFGNTEDDSDKDELIDDALGQAMNPGSEGED